MKIVVTILTVIILLLLGVVVYLFQQYEATRLLQVQPVAQMTHDPLPTLPADAVKISECIPYQGEHYVIPKDLPFGPFYTVYKGKIIATEYMLSPSDIPGERESKMTFESTMQHMRQNNLTLGDLIKKLDFGFDLYGYKYKTVSFHWSAPHAGFLTPHYDIHFFLVDKDELAQICPDAKIENIYSEEIMKIVDQHHIPFPGKPTDGPAQLPTSAP